MAAPRIPQSVSQIVTRSRSPTGMGNNVTTPAAQQLESALHSSMSPAPKILPPLSRESILSPGGRMTENDLEAPPQQSLASLTFFEQAIQKKISDLNKPLVEIEFFKQKKEDEKLNMIMSALNTLNSSYSMKLRIIETALLHEEEGVFPRIRELEKITDGYAEKAETFEEIREENQKLCEDVRILKGIVQVQDRKITAMSSEITDLRARSMSKDVVITGITGDESDENCKENAKSFITGQLKMEITQEDVRKVHRLGRKIPGKKPRSMVVQCSDKLRSNIFAYTKNLKGVKNSLKDYYYVDPQLPEQRAAEREEINYEIKKVKKHNEGKSDADCQKYEVRDQRLVVDGVTRHKKFLPPSVSDILNMQPKQIDDVMQVKFSESSIMEERGSAFYGYAASLSSDQMVSRAYAKLKLWHLEADHITMAMEYQGYMQSCDDGENKQGVKLQKLLAEREEKNVIVFVVREYGGIHLGAKHFVIAANAAKEALNKLASP